MAEQLREFVTAQFSSFSSVSLSTFILTAGPGVMRGGDRGIRGVEGYYRVCVIRV